MCTKLEIYARSGMENEYYLQNVNDTITHGSDTIIFNERYWTFDMIQDKA